MRRFTKKILFAMVCLHALSGFADACRSQLPEALVAKLSIAFPKYRAPLSSDSPSEDIEWNIRDGGTGCLRVASADFDGKEGSDYLVGLTAVEGSGALVVVALSEGKDWNVRALDTWRNGGVRLYVAVAKPGTVTRTEALDGDVSPGEELTLTCPHSFAEFGATESSAVDYCFTSEGWRYTWTSD